MSNSVYDRLLKACFEFTGLSDESALRSRYTFLANVLDEVKSANFAAGANLEQSIPVKVPELIARLQKRLDDINAVYAARKAELEAELATAEGFENAVKAWYAGLAAGLADGTYEIDTVGREGHIVAKDPATHAVPNKPVKKDVSSVQAKLKELEARRVAATTQLSGQLDVLGMSAEQTVPLTTTRWTNELNAPLPAVTDL